MNDRNRLLEPAAELGEAFLAGVDEAREFSERVR